MCHAKFIHDRHTCIRLCDHRHLRDLLHRSHNRFQLIRSQGAVQPDCDCTHLLQRLYRLNGISAKERRAIRFHSQRAHHRKIADTLHCIQQYDRLIHAQHRFRYNQIHTSIIQSLRLFLIDLHQLLIGRISGRLKHFSRRRHVARHIGPSSDCLFCNAHQICIQLPDIALKVMHCKTHPIRGKGRRINDLAARFCVFHLQLLNRLRMLQHPQLSTHADRHPCLTEIGAGRSIQ